MVPVLAASQPMGFELLSTFLEMLDSYRSAGWGPLLLCQIAWDLLGSVRSLGCNQLFTWEVMLAETLMNF